uniref:Uncharacterized protein n=1 Tax=Arundo donax TaxID=35708 RepID=A0A0A9A9A2_ARUDO
MEVLQNSVLKRETTLRYV